MHSGPLFGTLLYGIGGFGLPFWVIGALGIFLAVILYIIIPPIKQKDQKVCNGGTQLTIKGVTKVISPRGSISSLLIIYFYTSVPSHISTLIG